VVLKTEPAEGFSKLSLSRARLKSICPLFSNQRDSASLVSAFKFSELIPALNFI
jgi:hypothetical protein